MNARKNDLNILGSKIEICSCNPLTGYMRDGFCITDSLDTGMHIVCGLMTDIFLKYSLTQGNDLITPRPEFGFKGLKEGDHWCLCLQRWLDAYEQKIAPKVFLKATNEKVLDKVPLKVFLELSSENKY